MQSRNLIMILIIITDNLSHQYQEDYHMHPHGFGDGIEKRSTRGMMRDDNTANYWIEKGQESVLLKVRRKLNQNVAKNVILFLGDGMSIPTLSATRVYAGGVDASLSFDNFPYTGFLKTYCLDRQVADSACSSTAYLSGVKANVGTLGLTGSVVRDDCSQMTNRSNLVQSIAHFAQMAGKSTGFVTTSRVTHASPAGLYAHTAERDWESDNDVIKAGMDSNRCDDIARQLIQGDVGSKLNVILGGGRANFLPANYTDQNGEKGRRLDGINLIEEWIQLKLLHGHSPKYIWKRQQLLDVDLNKTSHLFGLFNSSHCDFNLNRDREIEPSLEEMTEIALKLLLGMNEDKGFFLFVEGAKIDMAHHETKAMKALDETLEFSKAVRKAIDLTDDDDTLIVVASDHAHTMSYSGYAKRGSSIFGMGGEDSDDLPYSILNYANGPAGLKKTRFDSSHLKHQDDSEYQYPAIYPMKTETHGGDDVAVFATGPWSHLFTGLMEQNVLPHLMKFASCIGDGAKSCDLVKKT